MFVLTASVMQVRYNAVRRQTAAKEGEKELQVLDYQNTNAELMPLVAAAYALIFMVTALGLFLCTSFACCLCLPAHNATSLRGKSGQDRG